MSMTTELYEKFYVWFSNQRMSMVLAILGLIGTVILMLIFNDDFIYCGRKSSGVAHECSITFHDDQSVVCETVCIFRSHWWEYGEQVNVAENLWTCGITMNNYCACTNWLALQFPILVFDAIHVLLQYAYFVARFSNDLAYNIAIDPQQELFYMIGQYRWYDAMKTSFQNPHRNSCCFLQVFIILLPWWQLFVLPIQCVSWHGYTHSIMLVIWFAVLMTIKEVYKVNVTLAVGAYLGRSPTLLVNKGSSSLLKEAEESDGQFDPLLLDADDSKGSLCWAVCYLFRLDLTFVYCWFLWIQFAYFCVCLVTVYPAWCMWLLWKRYSGTWRDRERSKGESLISRGSTGGEALYVPISPIGSESRVESSWLFNK